MDPNAIADSVLLDDTGAEVRLGETWAERPVALVFLRHFGCSFCREHVADLSAERERIEAAGGDLVAIGMGTPAHAADFRAESNLGFSLLVAEDTSVHEEAGLTNGSWMRVLGPRAWPGIVRATRKGHRAKLTGADMSQLGGTFVVDTDGALLWEHRARDSADNAGVDEIVAALARAA
jgi:peroxiredoxin